jgi:hypothetical protein
MHHGMAVMNVKLYGSSPVSRQTNPLLAFSQIGSTAWYASE